MKKSTILFLLVCLIGTLIPLLAEEVNLIKNPGFENGMTDWAPDAWREGSTVEATTAKVRSGAKALIVNSPSQSNDARAIQKVSVKPDTYYKLSAWIATENVQKDKTGANISLLEGFNHAGNLTGNSEWQLAEFTFRTSYKHTEIVVAARLGMYGNDVTGTAYFDDLSLVELAAQPQGYVPLAEPEASLQVAPDQKQADAKPNPAQGNTNLFWIIIGAIGVVIIVLLILLDLKLLKKKRDAKAKEAETTGEKTDTDTKGQ